MKGTAGEGKRGWREERAETEENEKKQTTRLGIGDGGERDDG